MDRTFCFKGYLTCHQMAGILQKKCLTPINQSINQLNSWLFFRLSRIEIFDILAFFFRLPGTVRYSGPPTVWPGGGRSDLPELPLLREPLPHGHPWIPSHSLPVLCKLSTWSHSCVLLGGVISPETHRIQRKGDLSINDGGVLFGFLFLYIVFRQILPLLLVTVVFCTS